MAEIRNDLYYFDPDPDPDPDFDSDFDLDRTGLSFMENRITLLTEGIMFYLIEKLTLRVATPKNLDEFVEFESN